MASIPDAWLAAPAIALDERGSPADAGARAALSEGSREEGAGDASPAALAALYAEHAPGIHRFLCDLLGDRAAAADATQETFLRAFRRLHTLEAADRPAPWLFGVARHVSMEYRRATRRRRRVMDESPVDLQEERGRDAAPQSPEDELLGREAIGVVRGALERLSEERRAALLLRLDHGLSYEEIARLLEWSVPKVKIELHRARQVLREELQEYEGGQR